MAESNKKNFIDGVLQQGFCSPFSSDIPTAIYWKKCAVEERKFFFPVVDTKIRKHEKIRPVFFENLILY